jgi:ankyrin repeat protein
MGLKTRNKKKSVLHLAVESKSMVTVKFVLSKDLDLINCEDNMSQTSIHYAASLKQTSILELLISKGACTTSR